MPRKKINRMVLQPPLYSDFKPVGVTARDLETIELSLDEYEAIRLADFSNMDHAEAASEMEISRSTFTRLIEKARYKLASFIIQGKLLRIDGGNVHFKGNLIRCLNCGHMFKTQIDKNINQCPACGSKNVIDLAGGYGHGKCCRRRNHKRR